MNQKQYNEKKFFHNIYCVGRNYTAFAEEMGNTPTETPIVFMKPTHSLAFMNDQDICLDPSGDIVNGEAEIVLSIGKEYEKGISIEELVDKMTIGIDFTYRKRLNKVKDKGQPWLPAKGFPGGAALGVFNQFSLTDIQSKEFSMLLNGKTAQVASASQMIFSLQQLADFIGSNYGLDAGDLIYTGTPKGIVTLQDGDHLEVKYGKETLGVCDIRFMN